MIDMLSPEIITGFLSSDIRGKVKVEVVEKTGSTNTLLRSYADEGAEEGYVIIAGEQTAGRGRMGRTFFSPGDTGVYLSLLLKPKIKPEEAVQITTAAAVSVCRALEGFGVEYPKIKWVNDVFIGNRKVCGILTEGSFNSEKNCLNYAILGVGVNMYESESGFPEEIKNIAGAIFKNRKENLRNEFIAIFLEEFFEFYEELSLKKHLKEYREKNFVIGKEITINSGEKTEIAKAIGVDDNCNLIAEFPDGTVKNLYSGEISVKLV